MKSIYFWVVLLYFLVGGVLVYPYVQILFVNRNRPAYANIEASPLPVKGNPYRIAISRLQIDLSVENGDYSDEFWTPSKDKALFATRSYLPNNIEGNTIIYGHNTNNVFRSTERLIEGDRVLLYTDSGIFEYKFTEWDLVIPTNTSVFDYKGAPPKLTLITCFGLNNSKRKLMYFEYLGVTKI